MLLVKEKVTKIEKNLKTQNEEIYAIIEEYHQRKTKNMRILK